jgi:outer membrane protein assembly factor BamB
MAERQDGVPARMRLAAHALSGVAFAAGAFCLVVVLLLGANLARTREADPLGAPALQPLRTQLAKDPGNRALREQIRALDLLNRRAYFSGAAFVRTGALLLLGGASICVIALRARAALLPRPLRPPSGRAGASGGPRARKAVAAVGVSFAAACAIVLLLHRGPPGGTGAGPSRWEERANQWPSFRGPDGLGRAGGGAPPVEWDGASGRNILWKSPVPRPGFSSPVVWGDRVFLTGGDAESREVYCFDAKSGALRWRGSVGGFPGSPAELPPVTPDTGHAASTAATDGQRVFAIFSTGDLAAFDFEGNRVWGRNLGVPQTMYGHASSLLVYKDLVLVQYDHAGSARLIAVRVSDGETAWERTRDVQPSWATPVLLDAGGSTQLVLNGNPFVIGYDPRKGDELWRVDCMGGELAPSPSASGSMVFVANQYARLAAIRLGTPAEKTWERTDDLPEVSSPLAVGSRLFVATGTGVVTCLDGARGEVFWRKEFPNGFYSSPVLAGGRVYLMDRTGIMRIFPADGEYRSSGEPALGEGSTATPAVAGGRLYLRGEKHLFCIAGGSG